MPLEVRSHFVSWDCDSARTWGQHPQPVTGQIKTVSPYMVIWKIEMK